MTRPRLLDLYCAAGGASVGYHRAGFDVTGVDINPQPDYPYQFHQGDALTYLAKHGQDFDAIHASPPCTEHTALTTNRPDTTGTAHLLHDTINALVEVPHGMWVVENVMGATMPTDLVLCGNMFRLRVYRHRRFTIGPGLPLILTPEHPPHRVPAARHQRQQAWDQGMHMTVVGKYGPGAHQAKMSEAMGIDWIKDETLAQAIPPAYTQFIGEQLIDHIRSTSRGSGSQEAEVVKVNVNQTVSPYGADLSNQPLNCQIVDV